MTEGLHINENIAVFVFFLSSEHSCQYEGFKGGKDYQRGKCKYNASRAFFIVLSLPNKETIFFISNINLMSDKSLFIKCVKPQCFIHLLSQF